jgi:hypothetical protein
MSVAGLQFWNKIFIKMRFSTVRFFGPSPVLQLSSLTGHATPRCEVNIGNGSLAPPHVTSLKLSKCESMGSTKPPWGAATIGSIVQYGDKVFYLAPDHFFSQYEDLRPTNNDSHSEVNNSEYDFGGLSDDDATTDDVPDFLSLFSVCPACSVVGSDFDSDLAYSEDEPEGGPMPESPSRPIDEGLHDRRQDSSYSSLPLSNLRSSQQLVSSPVAASGNWTTHLLRPAQSIS